ncbi:putative conserved secreted protein [Synechococcus sp. M16.1]|nr:putative conserved secreted protein [Synechococcus sp. M16.1]
MPSGGVMPMRSQGWWLSVLLGCSLNGAAHARSLDQQIFQLQLVMDQIRLARSVGDRVGVCVESRRANNLVLDLLPVLQLHRPGLNHAALQDRILRGFDQC